MQAFLGHRCARVPLTGLANPASPLNISEPFNFQHITHTQPHHVRRLDSASPEDLVSEFSALRASQASQPELKGINAKDIQREDLPRDALLPDCPSQLPDPHARLSTSKTQDLASDSAYGAMSPAMALEYSRLTESFSHPNARYYTGQTSPASPSSRISSHQLTPDIFTFHDESPSDTTSEPIIPIEFPETLDDPLDTWNDGLYDLAPPHAVSTDDSADWNRQVPFSLVKTELAPVEEEEEEVHPSRLRPLNVPPLYGPRNHKSSLNTKNLYRGSDGHTLVAADPQGQSRPSMSSAWLKLRGRRLEDNVSHSPQTHGTPPTIVSEPFIEDPTDDIPIHARFSRCFSVCPNDMDGFWALASDAINCSYALGAECDSNFDWHHWSIHEDDTEVAPADADATDTPFASLDKEILPDSHFPSEMTIKRSSSVYSNSSIHILPLQMSPTKSEPPSASSTESSSSSFPGAVTPNETAESPIIIRFPAMNSKEWSRSAYVVPNDLDSQAIQEDLYHQLYAGDYSQETPLQIHNVGRVDGSTISNSPRSSRSPISKSSSQESFRFSQSAYNTRRPRNAGSIGSLPELVSSKNSRERFDFAADQYTDNAKSSSPSESASDSQQTLTSQRRHSPNLAKDVMLFKVRTAEEPLPPLPTSRSRASSDVTSSTQDSSTAPPAQSVSGRRMRSGR